MSDVTITKPKNRIRRYVGLLNGPQTMGKGHGFWIAFLVVVVIGYLAPSFLSRYEVLTFSNFLISGFLAASLSLLWGYCGILSLGQAAFFGIGGYTFGVVGINLFASAGNTHFAILLGILVPVLVAAVIGGVMFFARLKGVYIAILMLVVALLFETFLLQTADPIYTIGDAALGGYNGLRPAFPSSPQLPSLTFEIGQAVFEFDGRTQDFYFFVLSLLIAVYLLLRCLVNSSAGFLMIACREDPDRTETFGYDVRLIQLGVFCLSAGIAGLAGVLYTSWGTYVHPKVFGVAPNILVVIWVAVGGRKDLTAAIAGAISLEWLSLWLTTQGEIALLVLGAILVFVMLIAPDGIFVLIGERLEKLRWKSGTRRHSPELDR